MFFSLKSISPQPDFVEENHQFVFFSHVSHVFPVEHLDFHILGTSSSQLTNSYFFRGVGIPPTINAYS